uniref:Solute carrier family 5 member 12 n=1 Tax=Sinocyclocheilus rhinocerous TaxID=307959 RepID=A0A673GGN2_9TELE
MEDKSHTVGTFQVGDYVVFAFLFVVSSGIGVFFAIKERKKKASSKEFLVGGRQMSCGPVALSLTASFMSAVTVIGAPSDVYRYGASYVIFGVAYTFVVFFTAELFLPVFYRSGITSTYEYLELRFCKLVRFAATFIYIIQTNINYINTDLYFFLSSVTGFDLWGSIFATGIVCTFYCTLGGLKAVVWTDAFQMVVMVVGFLTVLIQGASRAGGIESVWSTAHTGGRMDVFDFDINPLRRHTFWTLTVGGTFTWLGIYGVNQSTIQRCISCKTEGHARWALYLNLLGLWIILFCAVVSGLIMYTFYSRCDPWSAGSVSAPDQLMPYFVMEILGAFPGLPGLFVACAFSGTLSTVAASINALATVTYEDFVSQCFRDLSNRAANWISKALCKYTQCVQDIKRGYAHNPNIDSIIGSPDFSRKGLMLLTGRTGGLIVGIALSFWVGVGAFIYPAPSNNTRPLELNTAGCKGCNTADGSNQTSTSVTASLCLVFRYWLADSWYSMSYLYYSAVGFIGTVAAGLLITLLTGPMDPKKVKPGLTRSVKDVICFCSEKFIHTVDLSILNDLGDFGMAWEKHTDTEGVIKMEEKVKSDNDNLHENSYTNAAFDHNETSQVQAKL